MIGAVSKRSRRKKYKLFMEVMRPTSKDLVLDVGVDPGSFGEHGVGTTNYLEYWYPWPQRIVATGLHDGARFRNEHPHVFTYVQCDARLMPFDNYEYDIAFSNAVIEHVGSWYDQQQFAFEVSRVARRYFITTPNRHFPIETHTRFPFVHWLPDGPRDFLYHFWGKGWAAGDHRLLTVKELKRLFPDGKVFNFGMTLVVTNA